jgi:hypothetical protein
LAIKTGVALWSLVGKGGRISAAREYVLERGIFADLSDYWRMESR